MLKKEYGCEHILNSTLPSFDQDLKKLAQELNATVALEAVAGDMPGRLLSAMPSGATVITYGQLSEKKIGPINPTIFIFKSQKIEPFLLPYWLQEKSLYGKLQAIRAAKPLIQGVTIGKCFGLHQIKEAIEYYKANMTSGKVFLKPSLLPGKKEKSE